MRTLNTHSWNYTQKRAKRSLHDLESRQYGSVSERYCIGRQQVVRSTRTCERVAYCTSHVRLRYMVKRTLRFTAAAMNPHVGQAAQALRSPCSAQALALPPLPPPPPLARCRLGGHPLPPRPPLATRRHCNERSVAIAAAMSWLELGLGLGIGIGLGLG